MPDTGCRTFEPDHPPATVRRRARGWLVTAAVLATAAPALAQVTTAPPRHVPGPVAPSSGKAKATPTTSPIPGPSTTGGATGPAGTGPAPGAKPAAAGR